MMTSSLFLRRALALDALSCAAMGLLMGLGAAPLAPLFGLPQPLVRWVGLALLPLAAIIAGLSSRPCPPRAFIWIVILGNLAWSVESFVLIGRAQPEITAIGTGFVAAQAVAVLAIAALEYAGLRKLGPAYAG